MKRNVTWEQVDKFIDDLLVHFKDRSFTGVYGPPRGGLLFAVMISHRLNIPMLMTPIEGCLIVDDIADTGITLEKYKNKYSIATMFYHKQSTVVPDFYSFEKKDDWVIYPWEAR